MPPLNTHRTGIAPTVGLRIRDDHLAAIDRHAASKGITRAEVLRRAVAMFLDSEDVTAA
jgi:hypothetical protein